MLAAAKAAAIKLTPEEVEQDSILPQVERIRYDFSALHTGFGVTHRVASRLQAF